MLLYLIRHAHALDIEPDDARPLSERGRDQVRTLAKFLRRPDTFPLDEIWHSPLVRARETAQLLAQEIGFRGRCREAAGLRPEDDPRAIARQIAASDRAIALVGHEPHLSALGSVLVIGAPQPPAFVMLKGSALALDRGGSHWAVRWHVAPEYIA